MARLFIIIDGCNEDYICEEKMPFLYNLKMDSEYVSIESTPSFASGIEIYSGKAPQTTDTFVDFCLGPGIPPFRIFKKIKSIERLDTSNKYRNMVLSALQFIFTGIQVDFANIPVALLPYFRVGERNIRLKKAQKKGVGNNLKGILKDKGYNVEFFYGSTYSINKRLERYRGGSKDFVILHYGDTDRLGHAYGPYSNEIKAALCEIDHSIKKAHGLFKMDLESVFIFSDHDMVEVNRAVDLWTKLKGLDVQLIKDYLVFLNSPMARFWFKNESAEQKIRGLLDGLGDYGRVVTKEELRARGLPTDEKYGEIIFWANQGVHFCPDFYHAKSVKGMHGYWDSTGKAPFIIWNKNRKKVNRDTCYLKDIAPTVLDYLSVPYSGMEGKSLLAG